MVIGPSYAGLPESAARPSQGTRYIRTHILAGGMVRRGVFARPFQGSPGLVA